LDDNLLDALLFQNKLEKSLERVYLYLYNLTTPSRTILRPTGVEDIGSAHWVHLHNEYWGVLREKDQGWHLEKMIPVYTPKILYTKHTLLRFKQRGLPGGFLWLEENFFVAYERNAFLAKPPLWAIRTKTRHRSKDETKYLRLSDSRWEYIGVFKELIGERFAMVTWMSREQKIPRTGAKKWQAPRHLS
jgi:hypothetical protein